jgi:hypothetical protein
MLIIGAVQIIMRRLLRTFGMAVFVLGIFGVFGGRLLVDNQREIGGILFWAGLGAVVIGWVISSAARNKTCASCQARVPVATQRCERCGTVFG